MKRWLVFLLTVLVVSCTVLPVFAYELPDVVYENGQATVGLFCIKDGTTQQKEFIANWRKSPKAMVATVDDVDASIFYFIIVGDGEMTVTPALNSATQERFMLSCTSGITYLPFTSDGKGNYTPVSGVQNYVGPIPLSLSRVVTYADTSFKFPNRTDIGYDYLVRYEGGTVLFRFDSTEEEGGNSILDWLKGFWDKFVSLFVPKDGYFEDWFAEIKAAADNKLGSLGQIYTALKNGFSSLDDGFGIASIKLELKENQLFLGSPEVSADLLDSARPYLTHIRGWFNAVVAVFTAVCCYRRVITLFEQ